MDANGVERAILLTQARRRATTGRSASRPSARIASPSASAASTCCGRCRRCAPSSRSSRDHPVAYAVVGPSFWGDGMYPPSDAVYYPLYTKCCELDLPLCMNTGIPGPPIPGEAQNPIHLDRVCVRFPELQAVHDPRRRPVVGHRDPAHDQVPEPAADDLGVVAEAPARVAAPLHADARQGPDPVRLGLPGAVDGALPRRGGGARPPRRGPRRPGSTTTPTPFFFGPSRDATRRRSTEEQRWTSGPIDADNHYYEPLDAFTRHLDQKFTRRGRAPGAGRQARASC